MTRNQRIYNSGRSIRRILYDCRTWVKVEVAPGHVCDCPFVTINPMRFEELMNALDEIEKEVQPTP